MFVFYIFGCSTLENTSLIDTPVVHETITRELSQDSPESFQYKTIPVKSDRLMKKMPSVASRMTTDNAQHLLSKTNVQVKMQVYSLISSRKTYQLTLQITPWSLDLFVRVAF